MSNNIDRNSSLWKSINAHKARQGYDRTVVDQVTDKQYLAKKNKGYK